MTATLAIRTNEDLRDVIAATIPTATAEIVSTGGGCDALEVRHPNRPGHALLIGSADSTVLLDDEGRFVWAAYVGEYPDNCETEPRDLLDMSTHQVAALVDEHGLAEARRIVARAIVAHVHAWTTGRTVDEIASHVLTEIGRDIDLERVPRDVRSFSELHDHVDANDYLVDLAPIGDSVDADANLALCNAVTDIVNAALERRLLVLLNRPAWRYVLACVQVDDGEHCPDDVDLEQVVAKLRAVAGE